MKTINRKTRILCSDYRNLLLKKGYKYAGSGMYGWVYVKGDHAVKVGVTWKNEAYLDYVKAVAKSKSPFAPKFYELTYYSVPDGSGFSWDEDAGDFFVVTMERLKPLDYDSNQLKIVDDISSYIEISCDSWSSPSWLNESKKHLKMHFGKELKSLLNVCDKIITLAKRNDYGTDLHDANAMIRPETNQIVITDPLC